MDSFRISEEQEDEAESSTLTDESDEKLMEEMRAMGFRMGYEQEIKKHREILLANW